MSGQNKNIYPKNLNDLLRDPRYLVTRRYIRKIYPDPVTNKDFLLIFSAEGGICGVKSESKKDHLELFLKKMNFKNLTMQRIINNGSLNMDVFNVVYVS